MAKGIVNGKVPYIDLFDHKGPILYWMEALGYLFKGRVSAFPTFFQRGNPTEEFSMPFLLVAVYLQLRFLLSCMKKHNHATAVIYGDILGLLALIGLNNEVIPCCLAFCIAILLVRDREWEIP